MILQTIQEKIKQRRAQMLVHSYIYYRLDETIVSDHQWQTWADELVALQYEYPHPVGFYDIVFASWDGSTVYHLPHDEWVVNKANYILRLCNR